MADYYALTIKLQDEHHEERSVGLELPTSIAWADLLTTAGLVIDDLMAITNLGFLSANITVPVDYAPTVPAAGSRTDLGMTLKGQLDKMGNPRFSLKLPDPIAACILTYGNIDLTQANVDQFLSRYTGVIKTLLLSDGDEVLNFLSGTLDAR